MTNLNLSVGIVQINVSDIDEAWRFYVETLGLPGKRTLGPDQPFDIELGDGSPTILVYPVPQQAKRDYPDETGVTLVFYTNDIRSTIAEWKAKGVIFVPIKWAKDESGLANTPYGPFIAFRDPSGNVHELLEPVGQKPKRSTSETQIRKVEQGTAHVAKLKDVLDGFPRFLVPERTLQMLVRYALVLDTLGRLDAETREPLIDEHTLRALLLEFVDGPVADRLIHLLANLPACAFRSVHQVGIPPGEIPFLGLANEVKVFDASPSVTFRELEVSTPPHEADVVSAVRAHFPSLEEELLDPDQIPPRIEALLKEGSPIDAVLSAIVRQLGWWAAFVAVLLVPPASMLRSEASEPESSGLLQNIWPLSMYLLATLIGGWTLTVVGSCILAPVDLPESHAKT